MKKILQLFGSYWFAPMAPERLAIIRIGTGLFSLWYLLTRFEMMQDVVKSDISLYEPVGLASFLQQPIDPALFSAILYITLALNLFYILGLKFRYTGSLFALALFFVMCYRNSWSMLYHNYNALVLHVFIVGFVAAADVLSLDALSGKKQQSVTLAPHWQYGWPIKLLCWVTVGAYVLSGLAKILGDLAWDWMSGDAMRSQVAVDAIRKEMFGTPATALFEWIYPQTWLFLIMGIGTLILELGAPLAFVHRKVALIWVALTVLMHWGIFFIMDIDFPYHQTGLIFLSFLPLEQWWLRINNTYHQSKFSNKQRTAASVPSVVLFDGVCNFCDATIRFIIDHDKKGHFRFASIQSETGQQLLKQYNAPLDLSTIVLINPNTHQFYTKSTAILRVFGALTFPLCLLKIFLIVPAFLQDIGYDFFAKHRYQWFGAKAVCEIPSLDIQSRFL